MPQSPVGFATTHKIREVEIFFSCCGGIIPAMRSAFAIE
jgi:hypothetical protein